MPTLPPRYTPAVAPPEPSGGIANIPVQSGQSYTGEALQQAGKQAYDFAERIRQAQSDTEIVNADQTAREKLDKLHFDMQNDPQLVGLKDEDVNSTFATKAKDIIDTSANAITSQSQRSRWMAEHGAHYLAAGDLEMDKLVRSRQVDRIRGDDTAFINNMETKVGTGDKTTYELSLANRAHLIQSNANTGLYTKEQAALLTDRLKDLAAKDYFSRIKDTAQQLAEKGDYAGAYAVAGITPDKRYADDPAQGAQSSSGGQSGTSGQSAPDATNDNNPNSPLSFQQRKAVDEVIKAVQRDNHAAWQAAKAAEKEKQDNIGHQMESDVQDRHLGEAGITKAFQQGIIRPEQKVQLIDQARAVAKWYEEGNNLSPQEKAIRDVVSEIKANDLMQMDKTRFMAGDWTDDEHAKFNTLNPEDMKKVKKEQMDRQKGTVSPNLVNEEYGRMLAYAKQPGVMADTDWNADLDHKVGVQKKNQAKNWKGDNLSDDQVRQILKAKAAFLDAAKQSVTKTGAKMNDKEIRAAVHNVMQYVGDTGAGSFHGYIPQDIAADNSIPTGIDPKTVSREEYATAQSAIQDNRHSSSGPPSKAETYAFIKKARDDQQTKDIKQVGDLGAKGRVPARNPGNN